MTDMESQSNGEQTGEIKLGPEVLKARGMSIALANGRSDIFKQLEYGQINIVNTEVESDIGTSTLTINQLCRLFDLDN